MNDFKAPLVFDVEYKISQYAMHGNRASSPVDAVVSWCFSSCNGNLVYILEIQRRWPFKMCVCSVKSGLLSSCEGHLRILLEAWQDNRDTSCGEAGDPVSLSNCHSDIGIPINFQEGSGIVSF